MLRAAILAAALGLISVPSWAACTPTPAASFPPGGGASMGTQTQGAVEITGGCIDGVTIGANAPVAITLDSLTTSGPSISVGGFIITPGGDLTTGGALNIADLATANQLLYATSAGNVGGLATANGGVLVTNGSGVPSIYAGFGTGVNPTSARFDMTAPLVGTTYSDNVLNIINKSVNNLGGCGNSAIKFSDSAGNEHAAFGMTNTAALGCVSAGFALNYAFIEVSDVNLTGTKMDFALANTNVLASPFVAYHYDGTLNRHIWNNSTGTRIATMDPERPGLRFGDTAAPVAGDELTLVKPVTGSNVNMLRFLNHDLTPAAAFLSDSNEFTSYLMWRPSGALTVAFDSYYSSVITPENFAQRGGLSVGAGTVNYDNGGYGIRAAASLNGAARFDGPVLGVGSGAGFDGSGTLRATGQSTLSTGTGGELNWDGSKTNIFSINRATSAAQPLQANASSFTMALGGGNATITGGGTLTSLPAPSAASDAVTKAYADAIASGIVTHAAAAAASTANLTPVTLSGTGVGKTITNAGAQVAFAIDGYSASVNDRILIKDQTAQANNGIYTVTTVGSGATNWVLTRATDFDAASATEVAAGASVIVIGGTANAHTNWVETGQGPFTVDTTAIVFSQVTAGSNGSVNAGLINQLGYYAAGGTAISGLTTGNNGVLVTSGGGVPSISSTLPSALAIPSPTFTGTVAGSGTIPNSVLANSGITIGTTATALGATSLALLGVNSINRVALTAPATAATLTIADNKTFTVNKTLTLDGTDGVTYTGPTTSKTLAANDYSNLTPLTANAFLTGGGAATAPNAVALTGIVKGNGASAPTAVTAPTGAIVGTTDTQSLTNKTLTDQIDQEAHINTSTFTLTASTTLTSIVGFAQSLTAAGKYSCNGHVHFTTAPTTSNGVKVALATSDTLTVTTLSFTVRGYNGAAFMATGTGTSTALGATAIASTTAATDLELNAVVNVNAGGTLQVQMAENVASGTIASTAGSARWECHRAS